jgi:hypothetical protein
MPQCPQCNKPLVELTRQCPSCRADLDLLVDYVHGLQGSLDRAEHFTRSGELGQAVWAYLEVLEVDPGNASARHQVGQVATAVRQFDRTTPGRRWAQGWAAHGDGAGRLPLWAKALLIGAAVVLAFAVGFICGQGAPSAADPAATEQKKPPPIGPADNHQLGP